MRTTGRERLGEGGHTFLFLYNRYMILDLIISKQYKEYRTLALRMAGCGRLGGLDGWARTAR